MKLPKTLFLLPCLLAMQTASAQTGAHLILSDQFPAASEKISLNYDPSGTPLAGKNDIAAAVYYYDNKDYSAADIDLKTDGKLLKGEITVPAGTDAFFIKFSSGTLVDDNVRKGYIYLVYNDKTPVAGACAQKAAIISGYEGIMAKIKSDNENLIALYKEEFALHPQSEKAYEANYYRLLARNAANKGQVYKKIAGLEKSADEKDMMLAVNLLNLLKNVKAADSLNVICKTRFPAGTAVENDLALAFQQEKDLSKKESLYRDFIQKYPETSSDNFLQRNMQFQLAAGFLKKSDMDNYKKITAEITDKANLMGYLNNITWDWAVKGERLNDADRLSKQTVDFASQQINDPGPSPHLTPRQAKIENQHTYITYADTYGYILLKENKAVEALKYAKEVYDFVDETNSSEHYILALAANGMYDKAFDVASESIKKGQNSDVLTTELKKDYIKVKGSDRGYNKYFASLNDRSKISARAALVKTMVNQPAPLFTLKDLDGNSVSLSNLKGKIVIVDFWATWCGPCKASFPGMQLAVNKYKDDPNVKFLFVDTREAGDNYTDGVKKFIAHNKYTFHVLLDEKTASGNQEKVMKDFDVEGIPTKFIIDRNGNIRFIRVGFMGDSPKSLAADVTDMIDIVANADRLTSSPPTGEVKTGSGK